MELLDTILAMIKEKIPLNCEAILADHRIRILVQIRTRHWTVGWIDLWDTTLRGFGCQRPLRLDLADPSNTQEKIEDFIQRIVEDLTSWTPNGITRNNIDYD